MDHSIVKKDYLQPLITLTGENDGLEKIFHLKLDATKNMYEQKALASSQIIGQLNKYDGKGHLVVLTEIAATEFKPGREGDSKKAEQDNKISELKSHINADIHQHLDPVRLIVVDDVKISNPEQKIVSNAPPTFDQAVENKVGQNLVSATGVDQKSQVNLQVPISDKIQHSNSFHVKVDASKNIDEQKLEANKQITAQLGNYDGNGKVSVHREINTKQIDRSDMEAEFAFSFQEVMVNRLQEHITREVQKQTNAARIATTDEIKIAHPEQRQVNETKPVLEKDNNKQESIVSKATEKIKQDNNQIQGVKKAFKR